MSSFVSLAFHLEIVLSPYVLQVVFFASEAIITRSSNTEEPLFLIRDKKKREYQVSETKKNDYQVSEAKKMIIRCRKHTIVLSCSSMMCR